MARRKIQNPYQARDQYRANVKRGLQGQNWNLFDINAYAAAGQATLNFFQNPVGAAGKTEEDTNMEGAGALPSPQMFAVFGIEVHLFLGEDPVQAQNALATTAAINEYSNDVHNVMHSGFLDFKIMEKSYCKEGPLNRFPPSTSLDFQSDNSVQMKQAAAADETTAITSEYATARGRIWGFGDPIIIQPTQNFKVTLGWPSGVVALASGVAGRIGVYLIGTLYRPVQ